ncbi:MAG TPA: asparagine synthase (glutamine-hydrolyzing) [Gaiellaceae bacterium]|nr:asparagine synthase (glutamine-hydrolyzing) [Gaiellaceae bacterium]
MCGILGLASARSPIAPELLDSVELLRHRGPDSSGTHLSARVALAMRRLSIIDLDGSEQPVSNEAGDVHVVCNGEIYNYVELRAELRARGHRFSTEGDVETVVHLYEELGEGCFERLRGMFALAIWDERRGRLVLGRDRFGIKPLYVGETDTALAFSSEIAPLLELGVPARPDPQAVADYLSLGYVPGEATGLLDVRALAPGSLLTWEDGTVREQSWWRLEPDPAAALEQTLVEAVRQHLRSDVPLAVLLSGGLDSSLIAALAAAEGGERLHTFTVGFDEAAFDELEHARTVAAAIGSEHHEVVVRPDAVADLPEIVRRLDEPLGDPSAIPLFYVCRAASQEVKVALAGEGGDEVFGGYSRYAWDRVAGRMGRALPIAALAAGLERVPGVARRARGAGRKDVVRRAVKLLRHAGLPAPERYFSWFALLSEEAKGELLGRDGWKPGGRLFERWLREAPQGLSAMGRLQYVDLRGMLAGDLLLKADRMSMAHSLELRVPLLDHRVVEAGLGLPDREKVRGVETKRALRRLVAERLPEAIARRPKQGFEVPIDRWMRGELAGLARELLSPARLDARGLVDGAAAERLLRRHLAGDADHGLALYALMVLELWLEGAVDRRRPLARV